MAKISTYTTVAPQLSDMLIGTDVNDMNNTKNFTVGGIISLANLGTYVPYTGATGDVDLGVHGLTSTRLTVSNNAEINQISAYGNTFYIADNLLTAPGLQLEFANNKYYLGDVISNVNGTYVLVDDANSRIEFSKAIRTNGSTGTSGQVLTSQGSGSPATWVSPSAVYSYEIHVSQVDGSDTTGTGTLLNPVATITYALTLLTGSRKTIIVHPGSYTENVTVANTNTTIATTELTGANTLLSGTLTIGSLGSGTRISGLKMSSLVISGTAQAYISNCTVDTQVTKSSSGYVEIINSEMQCTLGIQITGSNITIINGNKNVGVSSVSNASAQVIIKGCNSVVTPSASAGNLAIVDCIVTALGGNAITITGASTTLTLLNSQVLVAAGNNVAPISVAGIYTIINTLYDKPSSTLTGTSTNSIDYFQFINVDQITASGNLVLNPVGSIDCNGKTIDMTGGEIHKVPLIHSQNNVDLTIEAKGTADLVFKTNNVDRLKITDTGGFTGLPEVIQLAASDETTALTAGTGKVTFRMPYAMTVTAVRASLTTAQTSGSIFTVDINEGGTSILSTKLTIDNTEKTSVTAATPPVISDTALADDAEMTIDIDQIGDGTAKGLKVTIIGTRV